MKGILKGSLFSIILIMLTIALAAIINMKFHIPDSIFKGILWVISGFCVFAGVLPVTKSATSGKFLHGMGCAFTTIIIMLIIISIADKRLPVNGSFYAYGLICILCGFLGTLTTISK